MGKEGIFNSKNVDLKKLAKLIEKFFHGENFSEVGMLEDPNGSWYEVQARKTGILRTLTSTRKSLHVMIKGNPDSFAVHVGVGEWGSNITAAALFNPTVSLVGIGLNRRFTGKLWNFVKDSVDSLENSYQKPKESTKPQVDDSLLILKRRLALGEITKEEFEELSSTLGHVEEVEQEEPPKSGTFARIISDDD